MTAHARLRSEESELPRNQRRRVEDLANAAGLAAFAEWQQLLVEETAEKATRRSMQVLQDIVGSYRTLNTSARIEAGWGS